MRPVVSYDDLSAPQQPVQQQLGPPLPSTNQPPAKKRRVHQKAPQRRPPQYTQHWDDPGSNTQTMNYDDDVSAVAPGSENAGYEEEEEEQEEESRELTHNEIWDDSALIDAWDSAIAEYEAYHGSGKKWKEEPVKKSPLWYNVPPVEEKKANGRPSRDARIAQVTEEEDEEIADDSAPLNFDTYVPTHDPSLASAIPAHPPAIPGLDYSQSYLPGPPGTMVSQDEAFTRALSAMYWGGYWTAVYHCQRYPQSQEAKGTATQNRGAEGEDANMDELVSTQR
ncbi:hypothetical protein PHLCEN_2v8157 [Hermanssonia centrifuga]|uniref:Survival Motor Neuron Gemin2-binding domain-containing protein n=1 Tax=Hermanssonia centrifuga TaxID=98765 RepID=A0A2R6NUH5_9APHY|nr:hypothetical protein PHLCEN_2v8157 [Hermanssonia centrifuga]